MSEADYAKRGLKRAQVANEFAPKVKVRPETEQLIDDLHAYKQNKVGLKVAIKQKEVTQFKPPQELVTTSTPRFNLPFPPSVNGYWRNLGDRTILSKRAREYRKAILAAIGPVKPLLGRLNVVVTLFPPDKRRRDLDNYMKSLFDALQHAGVYRDDEQIDEFTVKRGAGEKGGRCSITIKEV